jgi:hypothetical protein
VQNYGRRREVDRRSFSANRQTLDSNAPPYSSQVARNNRADNVSDNGKNRRSENVEAESVADRNLSPTEKRTQCLQAQNLSDSDAYKFNYLDMNELTVFH